MVYTMYTPALGNIHGISMVYTMDIPCKIFIGVPDVSKQGSVTTMTLSSANWGAIISDYIF